ncbi:MAG: hypothetical protein [Bacteriophage sp.]|nr:MAG: hypothetical protein [Bacteriophage sp.]
MKLTSNNKKIIETTIDFICALVFKDEITAINNETQQSAELASNYISAYLKTDNKSDHERSLIIENYIELNPYYQNLKKQFGIEPFISRLAKDLDIIYQPEQMFYNNQYLYYYRTIYKQCLQSFYITSYSQAMATKENYREFCLLHINIMTFINLLSKWLENPFDIDLMTESQVDRFMYSFGISFFRNLPFRYKSILAKNLNKLIINKGTDKVIIDILDLFGFSNIDIHKYYLARNVIKESITLDGDIDYRNAAVDDVYFLSHKIGIPSLNIAIKNGEYKKLEYDRIANIDAYWKVNKNEVAALDFDFIETKYFSIETGFDISVEIMNTAFLFNLLKYIRTSHPEKEKFEVLSNFISSVNSAKIEDIIITLQILLCEYQGLVDMIQYDLVGIAKVYEFSKYDPIGSNEALIKDLPYIGDINGITMFDTRNIGSYDNDNIFQIYNKNISVRDRFEELLTKETNYKNFKKLKAAKSAKFIQKLNYDIFNGKATLTDYLRTKNVDLYAIIERIRSITDIEERNKEIENNISNLTDILSDALNKFNVYIGSASLAILMEYIKKVILTFKSFTVSLLDLSFFMVIKEKNDYRLFDEPKYTKSSFLTNSIADLDDKFYEKASSKLRDNTYYGEFLRFFIFYKLLDRAYLWDLMKFDGKYNLQDITNLEDTIKIFETAKFDDNLIISDAIIERIKSTFSDTDKLKDDLFIKTLYLNGYFSEDLELADKVITKAFNTNLDRNITSDFMNITKWYYRINENKLIKDGLKFYPDPLLFIEYLVLEDTQKQKATMAVQYDVVGRREEIEWRDSFKLRPVTYP